MAPRATRPPGGTARRRKTRVPDFFCPASFAYGETADRRPRTPGKRPFAATRALGYRICFRKGTLVRMAPKGAQAGETVGQLPTHAEYREIQTLQAGDLVLAWDEKTRTLSYREIRQTFVRTAARIYDVEYENSTSVSTTWSHPFYIAGEGWVRGKDLRPGMRSATAKALAAYAKTQGRAVQTAYAKEKNSARDEKVLVRAGAGREGAFMGNATLRMASWTGEGMGMRKGVVDAYGRANVSWDSAVGGILPRDLEGALAIADVGVEDVGEEEVYNIDVEGADSYFVTRADVLVHNGEYNKSTQYWVDKYVVCTTWPCAKRTNAEIDADKTMTPEEKAAAKGEVAAADKVWQGNKADAEGRADNAFATQESTERLAFLQQVFDAWDHFMSFVGFAPGAEPKFEDQHRLKQGSDGSPAPGGTACVINSVRTLASSVLGQNISLQEAYDAGRQPGGGINVAAGGDVTYDPLGNALGLQGYSWNNGAGAYIEIAKNPGNVQEIIASELAQGHVPVLRLDTHSINIMGTETVNGTTMYVLRDQGGPEGSPGNWVYMDPSSVVTGYNGDQGWQLHRQERDGTLRWDRGNGHSNVGWGIGYYAKKN
jgi:hypothetical protein